MKSSITIIVPIYKVEPYLCKCIDSVLNQTYKDFDLILVDDGSNDKCGSISDYYQSVDSRIIVIHKINGGLSDARNVALDLMDSEYVMFVDSDDYIAIDGLQTLYESLTRTKSDISIGNIVKVDNKGIVEKSSEYKEIVLNKEEKWSTLLQPCAQNKLYKSYVFKELRYPKGKLYEDLFIYHNVLELVNRIVITGKDTYYYLDRDGSIMNTKYNIKFTDVIDALNNRVNRLDELGEYEYVSDNRKYIYTQCAVAYAHLNRKDIKEKNRLIEVMKIYNKHYPKLIKEDNNIKQLIRYWMLRYMPNMHTLLYGRKMEINLK